MSTTAKTDTKGARSVAYMTDTATIVSAMRALANAIQSPDGVTNAAIGEAADRLEELDQEKSALAAFADNILSVLWDGRVLDGADIQSAAIECGLLAAVEMDKPCGADCLCECEGEFPTTCLLKTYGSNWNDETN